MLGEELHLPLQGVSINLRGSMKCIVPVEKVEVLNNGRVIMTIPLSDAGRTASFDQQIDVKRSGWYTLRAYTTRPVHPLDVNYAFAETSPIYVYCGDRPIRSAEDAARCPISQGPGNGDRSGRIDGDVSTPSRTRRAAINRRAGP